MATTKINDMYEKATLAMAAYADGKTKADLEAIDFSEEQADQFLAKYEELNSSDDTLTGFSGTFYEIKTGDNAGDIVFALRGTDLSFSSFDAILETIQDLTSDAQLAIGGVAVHQILDKKRGRIYF